MPLHLCGCLPVLYRTLPLQKHYYINKQALASHSGTHQLILVTKMHLYITAPPVIVANVHKYAIILGSRAVLRCNIIERGIPLATFSWKKDGSDLSSVYRVSVNDSILTLQLSNVTMDSSGVYVCTASNKLSYHTDTVELIVKRK